MGKAVLLTGSPGCGKTTLIQRVLERLERPAGGFFTQELRQAGIRKGFEIVTLDGRRGLLAHVDLPGPLRVGRYRLNMRGLEELAAASIRDAVAAGNLVVVDEIGPMELLSLPFRESVQEALRSPCQILGAVMRRSHPFADRVKAEPGVVVLEVRADNREQLVEEVLRLVACDTGERQR